MKNIIFIAPPAAGKGTISDYLTKNYNYKHLSTGDLLRKEVASESKEGEKIKKIMANGELVSDEIIINLVQKELDNLVSSSFILDGFPRTINQALMLDKLLANKGINNNVVIYLDIPEDLALKRVLGRVNCPKCGRSYNTFFAEMKPNKENICDDCKTVLASRIDDNEESFKKRFKTYLENTSSLLDYYEEKELLKKVSVDNNFKEVIKKIKEVIND